MPHQYFADRDLGKRFPTILTEAGLAVERHDQLFEPAGTDEEWLAYCGTNGRVALTHNARIRYTPNELQAVIDHNVRLVVISGNDPYPILAHSFVATLAKIESFLAAHEPPFIAKVYQAELKARTANPSAPGRIELWYPKAGKI